MSEKVVCVVGPTASGKTGLAARLAKAFDGEVVSCDSMQIYRGMDIGTATPTEEEMLGVPHHLLSYVEPGESYSVWRYVNDATAVVDDILARGKLPVIAGGTGLYFDSLIRGLDFEIRPEDDRLRQRLSGLYERFGPQRLHRLLTARDPLTAGKIAPNDKKRVVRGLEVVFSGGSRSRHDAETRQRPPRYDAVWIGLDYEDRQKLYDRIDRRVELMFRDGLIEEARRLIDTYGDTAAQAIGYKELAGLLAGEQSEREAIEALAQNSRRYAKRQLTWFRKNGEINWLKKDYFTEDKIFTISTDIVGKFVYNGR